MKYDVTLFALVRVKVMTVSDVASEVAAAHDAAEIDLHALLDHAYSSDGAFVLHSGRIIDHVEFADEIVCYRVDRRRDDVLIEDLDAPLDFDMQMRPLAGGHACIRCGHDPKAPAEERIRLALEHDGCGGIFQKLWEGVPRWGFRCTKCDAEVVVDMGPEPLRAIRAAREESRVRHEAWLREQAANPRPVVPVPPTPAERLQALLHVLKATNALGDDRADMLTELTAIAAALDDE